MLIASLTVKLNVTDFKATTSVANAKTTIIVCFLFFGFARASRDYETDQKFDSLLTTSTAATTSPATTAWACTATATSASRRARTTTSSGCTCAATTRTACTASSTATSATTATTCCRRRRRRRTLAKCLGTRLCTFALCYTYTSVRFERERT
jgi:hypothetical protein